MSEERCARCGHLASSHNPFSKGPCYVRNVVGDRRSTYGKHYLSHKEVVCPCSAFVPASEAEGANYGAKVLEAHHALLAEKDRTIAELRDLVSEEITRSRSKTW